MSQRWTSLLVVIALASIASAQRGHGGGGGGHSSGGSGSGSHSTGGSSGGRSSSGYSGGRSSGGYSGGSSGYSGGRSSGGYDGRSSGSSRSSRSDYGGGTYGGHRSLFDYAGVRGGYGDRGHSSGGYSGHSGYSGGLGYNGYGHGYSGSGHYGGGFNHSFLGVQIDRNRPHGGYGGGFEFGGVYGGLRYGYVGFGFGDPFFYPYYAYDPFAYGVVASPWYPYSYLPPYIGQDHVVVVDHYDPLYDGGSEWRDEDRRGDSNVGIDEALDDVRDAFDRGSRREAERLLPDDGQVAIFNQGKYDYSLGASDFRDMFLDGVEASKTTRYEIVERRVRGDEVHVRARHEFTDSFGKDQAVFHTYTLRQEDGRYVIREFGSE